MIHICKPVLFYIQPVLDDEEADEVTEEEMEISLNAMTGEQT